MAVIFTEQMMSDTSDKPIPPADGECCESGCEPCVWDTYYEELRLWQEKEKQAQKQKESKSAE